MERDVWMRVKMVGPHATCYVVIGFEGEHVGPMGRGARLGEVVLKCLPLIWNILNEGIGFRERIRGILGNGDILV